MICPSCKCEYRAGVTQCADCGVPLVDALEPAAPPPPGDGSVVSIWYYNDPAEYASAKEALQKANIPFVDQASTRSSPFPSLLPKMEILVSSVDKDRAKKALFDFQGLSDPEDLTEEEIESLALPEKEDADQDESVIPVIDPTEDWDNDEPATEIWAGAAENLADTLIACFRENGIPSHKLSEAGCWRLVVRPGQEARAKEIVREVVEASPPA
jgi:hypothetical protein